MGIDRRGALLTGLAAGLLPAMGARGAAREPVPHSRWKLWYAAEARRWVEALPIGNGRLGAMLYGGVGAERIQLNEDSFWGGGPYDPSSPKALAALPRVRELIWAGKYAEAQALVQAEMMAVPIRQMSYATIGELVLEMAGQEAAPSGYRRWLDLERAEHVVVWTSHGRAYRRTTYASAPDQVIAIEIEAEDGGPFDATLRFARPGADAAGGTLMLTGRNEAQNGVAGALSFAAAVRGMAPGGSVAGEGDALRISGRGKATLLIAIRTSHVNWKDVSGDPVTAVKRDLDAAAGRADIDRKARHLDDYRRLYTGLEIDLGPDTGTDSPTDERIRFSHDGNGDPYLAALYVQYGRYLLISSSRPGGQPANLQGLWNENNRPPWGSKYTVNINTEMNYWPAEPLGLAECVEPLIAMVEDLAVTGARTARANYGARGWVCHHNTDLWRATAPIDGAAWGMWPTGGAWLCKHLWDRWDYGRDRKTLARIYPLIRDAGVFFLDAMVEHPDGSGLVTCPSMSPENDHHAGTSNCAGPAMDRQIIRELFGNIIAASTLLGKDAVLRGEFEKALARIPADRIGREGQLQEWLDDWDMDAVDLHHRHVSHLYALFPGHEIRPDTAKSFAAARRSLEIRGDDATGWGIGWRINLWARLGDGDHAWSVLRKLLGPDRTYPNLFDAHPPFQIDGNLGGAAGVVEMLVRDQPQGVVLLPALPRAWAKGSVKGVRLRGGLVADLSWAEGKLVAAELRASGPVTRRIAYGAHLEHCSFGPNGVWRWPLAS
ncbi:glycoside hydrolase family 95 protein [Sphingomonas sp. LB-2]|nr:glycoside hydrolase family 95 protein [Sphingomonas caeni]